MHWLRNRNQIRKGHYFLYDKDIQAVDKVNNKNIIYNTDGKVSVDVVIQNETVWLNQEQIALLFGKGRSTIAEHIQNVFQDLELDEKVVCRDFRQTAKHGAIKDKTQKVKVKYYNLDMIIAVGYRVKSKQGTQFRIWATQRLKEYLLQGFSLNEEKLKSGKTTEYFDKLQERLRAIRLSERLFYQKIKDIYTTSIDYDPSDDKTMLYLPAPVKTLSKNQSVTTCNQLIFLTPANTFYKILSLLLYGMNILFL